MKKTIISIFLAFVFMSSFAMADNLKGTFSVKLSTDQIFFDMKDSILYSTIIPIALETKYTGEGGEVLGMTPKLTLGLEWQGFMTEGGYCYGKQYFFSQKILVPSITPTSPLRIIDKNFTVSFHSFDVSLYRIIKWGDSKDPCWKSYFGIGFESFKVKRVYTNKTLLFDGEKDELEMIIPGQSFTHSRIKFSFKQSIRLHGKGSNGRGLFLDFDFTIRIKERIVELDDITIGLPNNHGMIGFRVVF
jgi:hypothetical protein